MSNEKLVRKFFRTLLKKFAHKVTAIEEAQDLTTMRVDELMGNLTTFEMSLDDGESSKKKGIALKASSKDVDDEDLVETMNVLAKNFNKSLMRFNKKPYGGTSYPNANDKGNNRWKKPVKQDEDEIAEEELIEEYKLLYIKWTELTMIYKKVETKKGKLKKEKEKLTQIVLDNDDEINNLNAQLKAHNKVIGKDVGDSMGIGYERGKFNNLKGEVKFVPASGNQQSATARDRATRSYRKRINRICYITIQLVLSQWVFKTHDRKRKCISQRFKHSKEIMSHLNMEAKKKIIEKGQLSVNGLPHLDDVLMVERLTGNLISISQLCDDGMKVFSNRDGCTVNNRSDQTITKGVRSTDNYYIWNSVNALVSRKSEDVELWNKKLGHTNYRNIKKLISKEALRGLPVLGSRTECVENVKLENRSRVVTKSYNRW
ncbi:hypothetical protein LIER_21948 [Lithospermum erythrorhizon]|uniref:GAG-pre-integrase domain-containing protein n=1 Tax=Lithospermum erythrorhizon TaxID=34254 RepID=A0AAV3QS88_LITER